MLIFAALWVGGRPVSLVCPAFPVCPSGLSAVVRGSMVAGGLYPMVLRHRVSQWCAQGQ